MQAARQSSLRLERCQVRGITFLPQQMIGYIPAGSYVVGDVETVCYSDRGERLEAQCRRLSDGRGNSSPWYIADLVYQLIVEGGAR